MKLLSGDPGQAADELAEWAENLERKAQQYQSLHGRMATVTVTETSSDNRISVTVDANGVPTDIRLSAAARGMDPAVISGEIMSCMRRAQAKLRNQVTDMVHDAVGDDAAGAAIIGQYIDRFPDVDPVDPVPTRYPSRCTAHRPPASGPSRRHRERASPIAMTSSCPTSRPKRICTTSARRWHRYGPSRVGFSIRGRRIAG